MEITVALDGEKKRDLRFFAGDDMSLTIVVYAHDGDVSPVTVTNVRFASADSSLPMDAEFVVPSNFFGRVPYRIVGEVEDITTTLCFGVMQTEGGWPTLFCDCLGSPWPYGIVGKSDNITVLDAHQNFDGIVSVEGALQQLGDFKKATGDIPGLVDTAVQAAADAEAAAQEAVDTLDSTVKKPDLAAAATVPAYAFSAAEAQSIFDNALPMQNYTALRAYTGRALGVRITSAGIAGTFQRDAADTTSADNGGTVIVDGTGRRWKRLFTGRLHVAWFGATGDGVTNDSPAFQACIDACTNGQDVEIDSKHYKLNTGLVFSAGRYWQRLIGPSFPKGSAGATATPLLDFAGIAPGGVGITAGGTTYFENLLILGPGASVGGTTIGLSASNDVQMHHVSVMNWDTGTALATSYYSKFYNSEWRQNGLGLRVTSCYNVTLIDPIINGGTTAGRPIGTTGNGILIDGTASNLRVYGGSIESYWGTGGYALYINANGANVTLDGVYFEPYGDATHISTQAIKVGGDKNSLVLRGANAYHYYSDYFIEASATAKFSLTASGNRFQNTSPYTSTLYNLPVPAQLALCSIDIAGDDTTLSTGEMPIYIAPAVDGATPGQTNINVKPPPVSVSPALAAHAFSGRPVVNKGLSAAPANPLKGAMYWADGVTWNPFKSKFIPYPVVYDGTLYQPVVTPKNYSTANNANITLTPYENVNCITSTSAVTVTLPASPADGDTHTIKAFGGANAVTVNGNGVQIDAASTYVLNATTYRSITVAFNQFLNRWLIVGSNAVAGAVPTLTTTATLTTFSAATQLADATAGAFNINLPTAASALGLIFNIKKIDASANTVTIDGNAAETIDGAATLALTAQWQSTRIQSNGTAWFVL